MILKFGIMCIITNTKLLFFFSVGNLNVATVSFLFITNVGSTHNVRHYFCNTLFHISILLSKPFISNINDES